MWHPLAFDADHVHSYLILTRSECCLQDAQGSFHVVVVAKSEQEQVQYYGAPAQVWYSFTSPGEDDRLLMEVLWVNKTATRLPEVQC